MSQANEKLRVWINGGWFYPEPISDFEMSQLRKRADHAFAEYKLSAVVEQSMRGILDNATFITDASAARMDAAIAADRRGTPPPTSDPGQRLAQDLAHLRQANGTVDAALEILADAIRSVFHSPHAPYQIDRLREISRECGLAATAEATQSLIRTSQNPKRKTEIFDPWGAVGYNARQLADRPHVRHAK